MQIDRSIYPMKKILIVFGTRPEAIKMAPLVKCFFRHPDMFEVKVCVTAQHREMLDQVLDFFAIKPDYDLDVMSPQQDLFDITSKIILGMKPVFGDFKPDYVLVHGDTTTSMGAALAAFYAKVKVCHIEAGLRTYNKLSPFPEEMNRQLTGRISDYHFAPTEEASSNLVKEGTDPDTVVLTGNTVIDALLDASDILLNFKSSEIDGLKKLTANGHRIVLVTGHRRENFGDGFLNICRALKTIAELHPNVDIIYPVHLNPSVQMPVYAILSGVHNIKLIPPLSYPAFVWLMKKSYVIVTDSGGIQEEAPSLSKPVIVMRDTTERPEAVKAGTVILVGTNYDKIVNEVTKLLTDESHYASMTNKPNPYGDGKAAERIVSFFMSLN